ncbi:MAG: tetratricopeptide repeat protein [Pseudomonadota bacterium]
MAQATLQLHGTIALVDSDGVDLTPSGKHARALIGLLARGGDGRMSRRDIESMLWTSEPHSRQMSLRSCLSAIRKRLARSRTPARNLLQANHSEVWLDTTLFAVVRTSANPETGALLEGITLQAPAFAVWLEAERQRDRDSAQPEQDASQHGDRGRRTLWVQVDEDIELTRHVDRLQTHILRTLGAQTPVQCIEYHDAAVQQRSSLDLLLQIVPYRTDDTEAYALALKRAGGRELLWRGSFDAASTVSTHDDTPLLAVAHAACDHVLKALWTPERSTNLHARADHLVGEAVRLMFSFVPAHLIESQRLLAQAHALRPHPTQQAWRALALLFVHLEASHLTQVDAVARFRTLANAALSDAPRNPMVLSLLSQPTLFLEHDLDAATAMAEDALALNPGLAMANVCASVCRLHSGRIADALRLAERGVQLGTHAPMYNWWSQFLSIAHIRNGDHAEAILWAQRALLGSPDFKAPLQHLYALYIATGQTELARKTLRRLRRLEPDFSLAFLRQTPDYPMPTLRQTPLIELTDVVLEDT